jgi:hypothetical protein
MYLKLLLTSSLTSPKKTANVNSPEKGGQRNGFEEMVSALA